MDQLDRDRTNIGKLQSRIAELEAENKRLNADLTFVTDIHDGCTEQLTRDHERAEQAEAEAEMWRDRCDDRTKDVKWEHERANKAEAALAEQERMLAIAVIGLALSDENATDVSVLADLRARAEEGSQRRES